MEAGEHVERFLGQAVPSLGVDVVPGAVRACLREGLSTEEWRTCFGCHWAVYVPQETPVTKSVQPEGTLVGNVGPGAWFLLLD